MKKMNIELQSLETNWKEILDLDPNIEYKITYNIIAVWSKCYFQNKNDSNSKLDPNKLPLLDDEYHGDGNGEPLYNDNNDPVFDPTQEINYELDLGIDFEHSITSKTLVKLLQNKIKELIDSEDLARDSNGFEFAEAIGVDYNPCFLDDLAYMVECDDLIDADQITSNVINNRKIPNFKQSNSRYAQYARTGTGTNQSMDKEYQKLELEIKMKSKEFIAN